MVFSPLFLQGTIVIGHQPLPLWNFKNYQYEIPRITNMKLWEFQLWFMNLELKDRGPQERSSGFFYTLSCEFRVHRAGSQVIIGIVQVSVFVW